jgi:hypothetical protein
MRSLVVFVLALAGCDQPRILPTVSNEASSPKLIEAEPAGRRGFAKREDFVCGGLGPSLLVIGARMLMLDGSALDERELRSVLRHKAELDRQLGAPTPTHIWVELLQPGRGIVAERDLLAAVREEGFTDIHLLERDVEASP